MEFFTINEIEQLSSIAGQRYDPNNSEHIDISEEIKSGLWEKTKFWANSIAEELEDFGVECKMHWHQQGKEGGQTILTFRHYTWAKIFKKGDEDKSIFFTVGVEGEPETKALNYKLDFKHSGKDQLSSLQQEKFFEVVGSREAVTTTIGQDELAQYSWEKLIAESINFIREKDALYEELIETIWPEKKRAARLTWNSNGWVIPSGKAGKSSDKKSHENRFGYGHEEWLFDTGKLIDGYHYGFLEPIRKSQQTYSNKSYDVWLYSINSKSKKRYWVGLIKNVEVLDEQAAAEIKKEYKKRGWLKEMQQQIVESGANGDGFSEYKGVDIFNIRYKIDNLQINDPIYELPRDHPIYKLSRYNFMHFKDGFNVELKDEKMFSFAPPSGSDKDDEQDEAKTTTYNIKPRTVEMAFLHMKIQTALMKELRKMLGFENVTKEHRIGTKFIDVVTKCDDNSLNFYEIKTFSSTAAGIREAIGQLFEYSYWPQNAHANKLVIVTPRYSDAEAAIKYVQHLRSKLKIPLYLQLYDLDNNSFSYEY